MTCKHARFRRAYETTTPAKSDTEIIEVLQDRAWLRMKQQHYVQVWRQYHAAEARKRGLL